MNLEAIPFPEINVSLNAVNTVLLVAGWSLILCGRKRAHAACMISALVVSSLFLTSYLTYHLNFESVKFTAAGIIRPVYFFILISHVILAAAVVPMVIATVIPAFRRRWDRHRRIAQWTMPVWLYVSVTGVLVYLMLYRWFRPEELIR